MESNSYFEVKVSYTSLENKKVNESYLVETLTPSDADTKVVKHLEGFYQEQLDVNSIVKKKYTELFLGNGDWLYEVKIDIITLDETKGEEKHTPCKYLVGADSVKEALGVFEQNMKGTMCDYTITGVNLTKIVQVFKYNE